MGATAARSSRRRSRGVVKPLFKEALRPERRRQRVGGEPGAGRASAAIPRPPQTAPAAANVLAFSSPRRDEEKWTRADAKRDAMLVFLVPLMRGLPATSPHGTNGGYYSQVRVLDEVLRAANASEDERGLARAAYELLLLLRPGGRAQEGAKAGSRFRAHVRRFDLAALRAYDAYAGGGGGDAASRALVATLQDVLSLADRKARLDLHGRPVWVQAVAVAAADNGLLAPDQAAAVLEKGSAVSAALLVSHAHAKRFLILPAEGSS